MLNLIAWNAASAATSLMQTWVSASVSGHILHVLYMLTAHGKRMVCAGVWATLQFKWVQLQYPVVVLAFEKLLLGACMPVAATVQAWGVIAALGLAVAPFCLALILAGLYCLFALPLPSSFAGPSRKQSIGSSGHACDGLTHMSGHVTKICLLALFCALLLYMCSC